MGEEESENEMWEMHVKERKKDEYNDLQFIFK